MCPADAEEAAALERVCFSEPWSAASFLDSIASRGWICLIFEDAGTLVGILCAEQILDEIDLVTLAVSPSHRRLGIASALLSSLFRRAALQSASVIHLEVRASNLPALRLYESHGFKSVGIRRSFYRMPREDAVLMDKYIKFEGR